MNKFFRFLLNCVKLTLKVWIGSMVLGLLILPFYLLFLASIINFLCKLLLG